MANRFESLKVSAKTYVDPHDVVMVILGDDFKAKVCLRNGLAVLSDYTITELNDNWVRAKNGEEPKPHLEA